MAFDKTNLTLISAPLTKGAAPSIWSYRSSADAVAAINTSGYFTGGPFGVSNGDVLYSRDSSGVVSTHLIVDVSDSAGTFDVTDGVTITATDSD